MTSTNVKHKTTRSWLVATVNDYLVAHPDMSAESFGWSAVKDSSLVERLRNGGDVTTKKLDMIIAFIQTNP